MSTYGKRTCPLEGCEYTREDYTELSSLPWILHMQFHIYFGTNRLPEEVK